MSRTAFSFVEAGFSLETLFRDQDPNIDSEVADYSIKKRERALHRAGPRGQLELVSITVCLYGPTTLTSKRVDWALKSLELGSPSWASACPVTGGRGTTPPHWRASLGSVEMSPQSSEQSANSRY